MRQINDVFAAYLTNKVASVGEFDLPQIEGSMPFEPDWIATFNDRGEYEKTSKTIVTFCVDDKRFEGVDKLFWAIIYKDKKALRKWKERFSGVRYIAAPDYSVYRDMPYYWQVFNIARSRIVLLWFQNECHIPVVPCASWGSINTLSWCFEGIKQGSPLFVNLKGAMKRTEIEQAKKALVRITDEIRPNPLIVLTIACDQSTTNMLEYPISKGIKVIVPNNRQKERKLCL